LYTSHFNAKVINHAQSKPKCQEMIAIRDYNILWFYVQRRTVFIKRGKASSTLTKITISSVNNTINSYADND